MIASEMAVKEGSESTDKLTHVIENLLAAGDVKEFTKQGYIPEAFKRPAQVESEDEPREAAETSDEYTSEDE